MTDKEKLIAIKAEIERLRHDWPKVISDGEKNHLWMYFRGLNRIRDFIDSLPEEPVSEDLEKVSKEWLRPQLDKSYAKYRETKMMELTHFDGYAMLEAIEFGAKWKEEQIMAKAVGVEVKEDAGGYPYISSVELYDYDKDAPLANIGDKCKVIIIKEDEL